ncbi:MAG: hypothetical protein JWP03_1224 [Phycisphaerales bacterium]|jgi:hypothetical protein|nr:hypothetical protein [Phycisphaerales bacterium]
MEHQDAEVSDITVVLKAECAEKLDETVTALKGLGMEVEEVDDGNGVVEGTIDAGKLAAIKKWPCVEYVRVEFTYIADYPLGDARDKDGVEADAPDDREE